MIDSLAGEPEAGEDIGLGQVRELVEDLLMAQAVRQEVQHVDDADAHSSDAGPAAALLGVNGDSLGDGGHLVSLPRQYTSGRLA